MMPKTLIIFASGAGTNAKAIIEYAKNADFRVSAIITDYVDAGVVKVAKTNNIPCFIVSKNKEETRFDHENKILKILKELDFNLIALAGYGRLAILLL